MEKPQGVESPQLGEGVKGEALDQSIESSQDYLLSVQNGEGYWVDELEANVTISAEYIFFMHFTGRLDPVKQDKVVNYLLHKQREDGSWPLFYGGLCDINSTVESYMALKMAGLPADREEVVRARQAIFANGGIKKTRVFTKMFLAMFGQLSWDDCPAVPVEIILFPNWFPFNIYEISSWSRGTVVPLSVVRSFEPVHELPEGHDVQELFTEKDQDLGFKPNGLPFTNWRDTFIYLDRFIKFVGKFPFKPLRKKALGKVEEWTLRHQEDEGDFAGIQPAMFNALLALHLLGYPKDHPACVKGMEAVDRFMLEKDGRLWMQACVSPLWDTAICANALLDSGLPSDHPALVRAGEWIISKQVTTRGDWKVKNPNAEPGGWAFEFYNELYPDTDDTAEILLFLNRVEITDNRWKLSECQRAMDWLLRMQSKSGGWGAFDVDNDKEVLNEVPFADHKALLDPATVDVTSRILWMLAKWGFNKQHPQVKRAIEFVKERQEIDGCWFGRWGVNYIYGTFLALNGLRAIGEDMKDRFSRKAVRWLESHQNEDGGWGETCQSYTEPSLRGRCKSTASQTAWALLGLIAADEAQSSVVERGVAYLIDTQKKSGEFSGSWWEDEFTGTGFPIHFFIKYHMYQHFFPLMALSRYRRALDVDSQ
ncbi:MAG: squalene--hopene cyclase [Nitrospinaceae bacterium]|mgnify:FL=1|nr:squalene--hopene cyclase [Nitrospinaceae bacterium]